MNNSEGLNPKDAAGRAKPSTACVPDTATYWMGAALDDGAIKYGAFNWRHAPVKASVYLTAIHRHYSRMKEGEWYADDSKVPHAAHIMASMAIMIDAHYHSTLVNDLGRSIGPLDQVMKDVAATRAQAGVSEMDLMAGRCDRPSDTPETAQKPDGG